MPYGETSNAGYLVLYILNPKVHSAASCVTKLGQRTLNIIQLTY